MPFPRTCLLALSLLLAGCTEDQVTKNPITPVPPPNVFQRLVLSYEQKRSPEYQGVFTGDFTYEFSNATDPDLVQQYSTGWFKNDEKESSNHLFVGYTPPGDSTLSGAASIDINLAVTTPTDDNSAGLDPATHKILATRVDGTIVVPQAGSDPITYVIDNNFNVFYIVRGDVAVYLDSSQPADSSHWYVYRWVDLTGATAARTTSADRRVPTIPVTWGKIKGQYH